MTDPYRSADPFPRLDVPRKLEMTEADRAGLMLKLLDESSEPEHLLNVVYYWLKRHDK